MADAATETPAKPVERERVRRRLDLNANTRGAFGQLLGTLSKAKKEDKLRNASEAAQKRQLLEKRLHAKLARETIVVRRQEQAKKDRLQATRREEELAMKENMIRHRQRQLPRLSGYLLTTDNLDAISPDDAEVDTPRAPTDILAQLQPPRATPIGSAPPPLFYLPAKLLPSQETFLNRRRREVEDALKREYEAWIDEKCTGLEEVRKLRESAEELGKPVNDDGLEEEQITMAIERETAPKEDSKPGEPEPEAVAVEAEAAAAAAAKEDEDMNDDGGHEVAY